MTIDTDEFNPGLPINIYADMQLSIGDATVNIKSKRNGRLIVFSFPSYRSAFAFFREIRINSFPASGLNRLDKWMKIVGVTLSWQNSRFGILGYNAKPYLKSVSLAIFRIMTATTFK